VIGGGFIGLEMVEQLKHRGLDVTLVQATDQVLPPFDREMATPLHSELQSKGVKLLLNESVEKFAEDGSNAIVATLKSGTNIAADLVIMSIGVRPDIKFLEGSGIELGTTGGIKVNEKLQTSAPNVWALGDATEISHFVTTKPMLIALAGPTNRQGRLVADNIFGANAEYRGTLGTAILRVFDLTAASTGTNERMLIAEKIPYEKIYLHPNSHAGYYPGAETISLKLMFSPQTGAILGAQAVGKDGIDKRIDIIATAIKGGLTIDDLADLELAYAPPFGSAKDPINIAGMMAQNVISGKVALAQSDKLAATLTSDTILLDVRDKAETERGAVPNAIHIPLNELRSRLGELDKSREIIAYCQSGQRSYYACRILSQNGFRCRKLSGDYKTWSSQKDVEARKT
jgi:rhodanese-related sulfurtransferase